MATARDPLSVVDAHAAVCNAYDLDTVLMSLADAGPGTAIAVSRWGRNGAASRLNSSRSSRAFTSPRDRRTGQVTQVRSGLAAGLGAPGLTAKWHSRAVLRGVAGAEVGGDHGRTSVRRDH